MTRPSAVPRPATPWQAPLLLLYALSLAGCANINANYRQGVALMERGDTEEGLARLEQAAREQPNNREFRIRLLNAQNQVISQLLREAEYERRLEHYDAAEQRYRRVLAIDRDNERARAGLAGIEQGRGQRRKLADARLLLEGGDLAGADQKLLQVLQDNPRQDEALALRRQLEERSHYGDALSPALRQRFKKPVSLEFRDSGLKQVLEALSRHAGLNFILDKDVPPTLTVTVFLKRVSVEDALDVILTTNQLKRRVLNDTSLLIYPDTAAKQGDHQDLVVKNFFLANAEAKQVANMLKTVLKAKNVFADDKLNLLIMRDTPAMIRLAERMVSIHDVSEPEVMLEVEVLEVQRSRLLNLGIRFPDQLTLTPLPSDTVLTLRDLKTLNDSRIGAAIPNTVLNLQRTVNDTNLLANPRIRTHNREKALIRIGDRVPVITTTATSTGFVSENVQYVDVGLKLEVEPVISPNNEITLKMGLEVSSVTREVVSRAGTVTYQIGGRNAATVLRLKDGETQVLGGLINDQDIKAANRFPGLGDLPVLGRLFSSQRDSRDKTELVLAITPRLVRGLAPPPQIPGEFWSGTENDPRLSALVLAQARTDSPPAATQSDAAGAGPAAPASARPPRPPAAQSLPAAAPPPTVIAPAIAEARPLLHWTGPAVVRVGSTFRLQLAIDTPAALSSLPLDIGYDARTFDLIKASPGRFMGQGDTLVETRQRLLPEEGRASIVQTRQTGGARGRGEILTLELRAVRPANGSIVDVLPGRAASSDTPAGAAVGKSAISIDVVP